MLALITLKILSMTKIDYLEQLPRGTNLAIFGPSKQCNLLKEIISLERPDIKINYWIKLGTQVINSDLEIIEACEIKKHIGVTFEFIIVPSNGFNNIEYLKTQGLNQFFVTSQFLEGLGRLVHRKQLDKIAIDCINIELTTLCDMKCEFCDLVVSTRDKLQMDFQLFKTIVNDLSSRKVTHSIVLAGVGEPLLYNKLEEAIEYASIKGLDTAIHTNGLRLTLENYARYIKKGLVSLAISLHNLSEKSFQYRHASPTITYEKYLENILQIIDYHIKHNIKSNLDIYLLLADQGLSITKIWNFSGMDDEALKIEYYLAKFVEKINKVLKENKVGKLVQVEDLLDVLSHRSNSNYINIADRINIHGIKLGPTVPWAMKKQVSPQKNGYVFLPTKKDSCIHLNSMSISFDGHIVPCCRIPPNRMDLLKASIGNYRNGSLFSFNNAMDSKKYNNFLNSFKYHSELLEGCQLCKGKYVKK